MTDYNELADRIERADGPAELFALEKEIAPLAGLRLVEEGSPLGLCCYDQNGHGVPLPRFLRSIDAAMQLVPEGWAWELYSDGSCAMGRTPAPGCILDVECDADGATPAQAIVAAALRARSAS